MVFRFLLTFTVLALPSEWSVVNAMGDPSRGEAQAMVCAACHGQDGASGIAPIYPNLAGQNE